MARWTLHMRVPCHAGHALCACVPWATRRFTRTAQHCRGTRSGARAAHRSRSPHTQYMSMKYYTHAVHTRSGGTYTQYRHAPGGTHVHAVQTCTWWYIRSRSTDVHPRVHARSCSTYKRYRAVTPEHNHTRRPSHQTTLIPECRHTRAQPHQKAVTPDTPRTWVPSAELVCDSDGVAGLAALTAAADAPAEPPAFMHVHTLAHTCTHTRTHSYTHMHALTQTHARAYTPTQSLFSCARCSGALAQVR